MDEIKVTTYELAEQDYVRGMKYKDIASKYDVTINTVKSWKQRYKWERDSTPIPNGCIPKSVRTKDKGVHTKKKDAKSIIDDGTKETMINDELTHEQRLFCIYFSKTFNATQSYMKAYKCEYDSAHSNSSRLMSRDSIRQEIQRLQEAKRQQIVAGESDIVDLHMRIAFADMGDYLSFGQKEVKLRNGNKIKVNTVDLKESTTVDTQLIQSIGETKDGVSIKLADRNKSLDWLEKFFLMNPMDKHKIAFDNAKLDMERKKLEPKPVDEGIRYTGIPSTMIAPAFISVVHDIEQRMHTEYVFTGGRGSTKSTFVSLELIDILMKNDGIHALVMRQVADTLRTSVFAQMQWSISALGLEDEFDCTVSPLEITRRSTGQKIYFRGADDTNKVKSIKVPFGYIGCLWLEELDQFKGGDDSTAEEAVRKIEQSVIRGGDIAYIFKSFNPPKSANNWANKYIKVPKATRLVNHSTYLEVPKHWLGKAFIAEAEHLKEVNPVAYENEYMGEANGTGGAIFDNIIVREITDDEIAGFDRVYNGVDWGWYPDKYAFTRVHYEPAQLRLYIWQEYTCNKQSNRQTADELIKLGITSNDIITCDSADNKSIGDYKSYGLLARPAIKGAGSREYSYKWLQSLKEIIIDNMRCPVGVEEFLNYEYERDKAGNVISGYPDGNDHVMDSVRYGTESIWKKRGQ